LVSSIWIYLYAKEPNEKFIKIRDLIADPSKMIISSTQVLGEIFNVLVRKKLVNLDEAKEIITEMTTNLPVVEIDTSKVLKALEIHTRYKYSYWDSLILATALITNCSQVYSEDLSR
jgi:predicted nucleic acid-binding protein